MERLVTTTTTTRRRRRSVNARGGSIGFSRVRFAGVLRAAFARTSAVVERGVGSIGSRSIDRIARPGAVAQPTSARGFFFIMECFRTFGVY